MTIPIERPVAARHLNITGRVQGVWYRNCIVGTARTLGLVGWVRNRTDGSVEAWVEGAQEAVTSFVTLAYEGPFAARVEDIMAQEGNAQDFTNFDKRATG